jgi:toxin FitB
MICDTNILIYAAEAGDTLCSPFVESPQALIASITRIELLGFPGFGALAQDRQDRLREIIATTVEMPLDSEIINRAITLRQQKKMSLGDAIIAATALEFDMPLVTRNTDDFKHIAGLRLVNPFTAS